MGLDMYLYGKKSVMSDTVEKVDGYPVTSYTLEVGYWRKHPDLHGFIVETFAEGKDECQSIPLSKEDIEHIISAIDDDALAHNTTGFFFGKSYQPDENEYSYQKENDLQIFRDALEWMGNADFQNFENRSVFYRASW